MPSPLWKKLGIKAGNTALLIDPPARFADAFALPDGASLAVNASRKQFDAVLFFAKTKAALANNLPRAFASLKENRLLWIAYPKKSGKLTTDLTHESGWEPVFAAGWHLVSLASIDETWTACRMRPVSASQPSKREPRPMAPRDPNAPRVVVVPPGLAKLIAKSAKAKKNWAAFSYTHQKEFARWIDEAKKEETRERRLKKAIAMIEAGRGGI